MQDYEFIGQTRFYPHWEDQSFTATHGDVRSFQNPPGDGLWIPASTSAPAAIEADPEWFKDK